MSSRSLIGLLFSAGIDHCSGEACPAAGGSAACSAACSAVGEAGGASAARSVGSTFSRCNQPLSGQSLRAVGANLRWLARYTCNDYSIVP